MIEKILWPDNDILLKRNKKDAYENFKKRNECFMGGKASIVLIKREFVLRDNYISNVLIYISIIFCNANKK